MDEDEREHDRIVGDHGVARSRTPPARGSDDQDPALAEAVRQRARERRRERRRVRQEAEEQTGRERAAAEIEDVERRRRQQLERGQEDREREPAHDEEARGEETIRRHQIVGSYQIVERTGYSVLSATTGLTRVARQAGTGLARSATAESPTATDENVAGSAGADAVEQARA